MDKRISFFWNGSKMSWLRYMTLYSFRKYHPDWDMYLYTSDTEQDSSKTWATGEEQDFFMYEGDDYASNIKELNIKVLKYEMPENIKATPSQQSNFFKWQILSDVGGIYSDMDILFIKTIDDIYDNFINMNGDVALSHNGKYFSIGFMMSSKNNDVFKAIWNNTNKEFNIAQYQGAGVLPIYKRWDDLKAMQAEFPHKIFYNIPHNIVYPFSFNQEKEIFLEDHFYDISHQTVGLHWFAGSKTAQEYNNMITEKNYLFQDNTISMVLRRILN